jgi:hypothetical protein
MCFEMRWRIPEEETRFCRIPANPMSPVSGFMGKSWPRLSDRQISPSSSAVCTVGGPAAMNPPLSAPVEVATIRSGRTPPLVERAQHPDLKRAKARAAGEHEGGARCLMQGHNP